MERENTMLDLKNRIEKNRLLLASRPEHFPEIWEGLIAHNEVLNHTVKRVGKMMDRLSNPSGGHVGFQVALRDLRDGCRQLSDHILFGTNITKNHHYDAPIPAFRPWVENLRDAWMETTDEVKIFIESVNDGLSQSVLSHMPEHQYTVNMTKETLSECVEVCMRCANQTMFDRDNAECRESEPIFAGEIPVAGSAEDNKAVDVASARPE